MKWNPILIYNPKLIIIRCNHSNPNEGAGIWRFRAFPSKLPLKMSEIVHTQTRNSKKFNVSNENCAALVLFWYNITKMELWTGKWYICYSITSQRFSQYNYEIFIYFYHCDWILKILFILYKYCHYIFQVLVLSNNCTLLR